MKLSTQPSNYQAYRSWFLLGLLVQLIAAWFSIGYHHPDEHFQVLEFCNYKLGYSPAADLPWEFAAKCRPALQPFIAYIISRGLIGMGQYNPFAVAFILRLMMGALTWWVTCRAVLQLLPELTTETGKRALVCCSFLLWFVPYIGVRFSAENIAGLLFFLSLSFLLPAGNNATGKNMFIFLFSGVLLGLAFFLRLQLAAALLALCVWLLLCRKWSPGKYVWTGAGFAAGIAVCIFVDHWFYNEWLLTPYNYFHLNIVEHVAARYGVFPWWFYFTQFLNMGVLPLSAVLLLLFFAGIIKKKWHPYTWVTIAFIAEHCLIAHKEMRFLFPVSIPFIFLACCGLDALLQRYPMRKKEIATGITTFFVINSIILIAKIFTPAHEIIKYDEAVYDYCRKHNAVLICKEQSLYRVAELELDFYKPKNLDVRVVNRPEEIRPIMDSAPGKEVIYLSTLLLADPMLAGYKAEKIYCVIPQWMYAFNFTDWESRSYIWNIYRLK